MFDDFYEAWYFLSDHRIYKDKKYQLRHFQDKCLDVSVAKVNPNTLTIDDDNNLNTKVQVWLESGKYIDEDKQGCHDIDLDTGADTFEQAIINLANLVYKKFGS